MSLTRRRLLSGAAAALVAGAAWAQQDAPRISGEEAVTLAAKGEAVVVDVRAKLAWDGSHAEGALSIPSAEIGTRLAELPKDKLIVAYCT
jgi:rhodanese-related sulfurtransferase